MGTRYVLLCQTASNKQAMIPFKFGSLLSSLFLNLGSFLCLSKS